MRKKGYTRLYIVETETVLLEITFHNKAPEMRLAAKCVGSKHRCAWNFGEICSRPTIRRINI